MGCRRKGETLTSVVLDNTHDLKMWLNFHRIHTEAAAARSTHLLLETARKASPFQSSIRGIDGGEYLSRTCLRLGKPFNVRLLNVYFDDTTKKKVRQSRFTCRRCKGAKIEISYVWAAQCSVLPRFTTWFGTSKVHVKVYIKNKTTTILCLVQRA